MEDKIILTADDGTEVTFYVIEETRLGASNYLLVADSDDGGCRVSDFKGHIT